MEERSGEARIQLEAQTSVVITSDYLSRLARWLDDQMDLFVLGGTKDASV